MHCNQQFCGNAFSNGQSYGYNNYNAPLQSSGIFSEIVGEGEVTSVALPDGTTQLFFIPTVKWWAPHAANSCPYNTNIVNANNPYCRNFGNNIGAWFVRTITNPTPPVFTNPMCPRYEVPIPFFPSECNLNAVNNGCQLKFHNDQCTSTTDLHYFVPRICHQLDCTVALPTQGCAAVQVNTPTANNTVCHYEFVCSKPCHCTSNQCRVPAVCQTTNAMSTEDTKCTLKDVVCDCDCPPIAESKKYNVKSGSKCNKIDQSCGGDPCRHVGTQSCCGQGFSGTNTEKYRCKAEPEMWRPVTALGKKKFESHRNSISSCSSGSCSGCIDIDEGRQ